MNNPSLDPDPDIKRQLTEKIKEYFSEELDQEIGDLKAELVYEFIRDKLGKTFYCCFSNKNN